MPRRDSIPQPRFLAGAIFNSTQPARPSKENLSWNDIRPLIRLSGIFMHELIHDIALCIIAAWALGVLAQFFRQPVILAYLIGGFAIGPAGFGSGPRTGVRRRPSPNLG